MDDLPRRLQAALVDPLPDRHMGLGLKLEVPFFAAGAAGSVTGAH